MNLSKLFQIQAKLDERIVKEHNLQGQDLLDEKILALQVELGELANEWRGFKFWSKDQEPRTFNRVFFPESSTFIKVNPLLEEYVDCLHFILSIGNELGKTSKTSYFFLEKEDSDGEIVGTFSLLFKYTWNVHSDCESLLERFIELGGQLGFTWEQIEQAYLTKNKINHERQDTGVY